jgi:hypothetical protein
MIDIDVIRRKALDRLDNRNVLYLQHAKMRMVERNIRPKDIKLIIMHGSLYNIKEVDGKIRYRFRGWCEDRRDAHVVFELQNGMMIVTVIEEGLNE